MPYLRLNLIGIDPDIADQIETVVTPFWESMTAWGGCSDFIMARWEQDSRVVEIKCTRGQCWMRATLGINGQMLAWFDLKLEQIDALNQVFDYLKGGELPISFA